jgi:hypothetical protein
MPTPLSPSDLSSTFGFFLTLTSLLGTFFYVHLSNWFREILELREKVELNSAGDDEPRKRALIECRFQLKRLRNHVTVVVSVVITLFIVVMFVIACVMISALGQIPSFVPYYEAAFFAFFGTYLVLTLYFLIRGYVTASAIRRMLPR